MRNNRRVRWCWWWAWWWWSPTCRLNWISNGSNNRDLFFFFIWWWRWSWEWFGSLCRTSMVGRLLSKNRLKNLSLKKIKLLSKQYLPNCPCNRMKILPLIINFVKVHFPERNLNLSNRVIFRQLVIVPNLQDNGFPGDFSNRYLRFLNVFLFKCFKQSSI